MLMSKTPSNDLVLMTPMRSKNENWTQDAGRMERDRPTHDDPVSVRRRAISRAAEWNPAMMTDGAI